MHRSEIKVWSANTAPVPTWRDGLSGSDRTYMIAALPHKTRNGYQAIVVGRASAARAKIKFYPDAASLGIEERDLVNTYGFTDRLPRPGEPYLRFMASLDNIEKFLATLDPDVWAVGPLGEFRECLLSQKGRGDSRTRHPVDGGFTPTPEVEEAVVKDTGGINLNAGIPALGTSGVDE